MAAALHRHERSCKFAGQSQQRIVCFRFAENGRASRVGSARVGSSEQYP